MHYYYIYQITNIINNKIYIGVHKTKNLDDGYMGSGTLIKYAIEKYGLQNFRKDILEFFNNVEDMYAREKEIVNKDFLLREDVYNIKIGGSGGYDYINQKRLNVKDYAHHSMIGRRGAESLHKKCKEDISFGENLQKIRIENLLLAEKVRVEKYPNGTWKGKTHSIETKVKISEIHKTNEHQQGQKNSQYGTMWIYNLETFESKKINREDIIPVGWNKGRKLKKE